RVRRGGRRRDREAGDPRHRRRGLSAMATSTIDADTAGRLRWLNLVVGLVHLVQAGAMWVLSNDLTLPVTASFLGDDPVAVTGPPTPEVLFEVPIGPAVALFLLLAAIDHL